MTERRWFGLNAGAANWLWLGVVVMALDQWTKWLIVERFDEFEPYVLLPVLEIMRLHNTGAAFSFLSNASGWQRWVFVGLGVAVSAAEFRANHADAGVAVGEGDELGERIRP